MMQFNGVCYNESPLIESEAHFIDAPLFSNAAILVPANRDLELHSFDMMNGAGITPGTVNTANIVLRNSGSFTLILKHESLIGSGVKLHLKTGADSNMPANQIRYFFFYDNKLYEL